MHAWSMCISFDLHKATTYFAVLIYHVIQYRHNVQINQKHSTGNCLVSMFIVHLQYCLNYTTVMYNVSIFYCIKMPAILFDYKLSKIIEKQTRWEACYSSCYEYVHFRWTLLINLPHELIENVRKSTFTLCQIRPLIKNFGK